jgi:transcriptional regulator with XRE-family HTH domain
MEREVRDRYVTRALGFQITIRNVEMRKFRGEWVPQIDWNALQHLALWALAHKPAPLTGNEVRFVRTHMDKTLKEFASLCEVSSHQSVMNWESKADEFTGMNRPTEIILRARILDAVPDNVWQKFESKRKAPKAAVAKVLDEVSRFEPRSVEPLSLFTAGGDDSEVSDYAYM